MKLNEDLQCYITKNILPIYEQFDDAHSTEHVSSVIENSMQFAENYPKLDCNIIYTVAAFHDVGIAHSREQHHIYPALQLAVVVNLKIGLLFLRLKLLSKPLKTTEHQIAMSHGRYMVKSLRMPTAV